MDSAEKCIFIWYKACLVWIQFVRLTFRRTPESFDLIFLNFYIFACFADYRGKVIDYQISYTYTKKAIVTMLICSLKLSPHTKY